ncbi:MAG: hypothetical protein EAZ97_11215 [Bacteroidetes bacterium]|nr:MAG: hypothetical protein EAZ97_11215 [Bacteroidota bacterium]
MKTKFFLGLFFMSIHSFLVCAQDKQKFELSAKDIEIAEKSDANIFDFEVVTASKTEEFSKKAPANIRVITEEEIRMRNYRSLVDVLADLGGIKIDELNTEGWRHDVTMNGVRGNQNIVILLDGVRISSPTNEAPVFAENYPVHFARQIEIIYGPASALYGADAVAGIINIISKDPSKKNNLTVSAGLGNYGLSNYQLYAGKQFAKDISLTVAGQYFYDAQPDLSKFYPEYDMSGQQSGTFNTIFGKITPKTKVSPQFESPLQTYAMFAKLKIKNFQFGFFKNYEQHSTSISVSPQNTVYNKDAFYGQNITSANMSYTLNLDKLTFISQLQGSIYEIDPKTSFRNVFVGMEKGYKYGFSNMFKMDQQMIWQINSQMTLMLGVTYERFYAQPKTADLSAPIDPSKDISGTYLGTDLAMKIFSINYFNAGGFAQLQYSPKNWLHFTLGTRYDHNSRFGGTFNPRLGVVVQPSKTMTIKALYGTAFLAPPPFNAFEAYGSFNSQDGGKTYSSPFWHLPNPNLQPIQLDKTELYFNQIIHKNFSLSLNAYYLSMSGLFSNAADAGNTNYYNGKFLGWKVDYIEVVINSDKQQNWGGGIQMDYVKKWKDVRLGVYLNADYLNGEITDIKGKKVEIPQISNFQSRIGFDLSYKGLSISPRLILQGAQRLNSFQKDSDLRQILDGYQVLNIAMRYDYKQFGIFADIRNALDVRYRTVTRESDLNNPNGLQMIGAAQNPMRIMFGVQIKL